MFRRNVGVGYPVCRVQPDQLARLAPPRRPHAARPAAAACDRIRAV